MILYILSTPPNSFGILDITPETAKEGIKILMSWGAAIVAIITALVLLLYPLSKAKVDQISEELTVLRQQ